MINESIDSLEAKLGKRKQFLLDNDLEKLQREFLAKKEKCNSKIIKVENKNKENEANKKILKIPSGEIKQKKGKKKVKDIISLNLPSMEIKTEDISSKNQSEASSLFAINFNKLEENSKNKIEDKTTININISTGLPNTFKIDPIEKEINIKENDKINIKKEINNIEII